MGLDIPTSAWVGTGILTLVTVWLFVRLGFSAKKERAKSWAALTILYVMWTVHLATLNRETAITCGLLAVTFGVISFHRYQMDNPTGRAARFAERHRWVPAFHDRT